MESTGSIWHATASLDEYAPLSGGTRADVCVVGAGIAGMTAAWLLQKEGKSVVVLDAATVGAGETGRTTAHFFPPDERYFNIEKKFGLDKAALVADSYRKATDLVESIVRDEGIECNFMRLSGYLVPQRPKQDDVVTHEYAAASRLGLDVELLDRVPGMVYDTGLCLRFGDNAQFHPLRYLAGLASRFVARGGAIYGNSRAVGIDRDGQEHKVRTVDGHVHCRHVVVATHTPFNDKTVMHTKQAGYNTYVLGLRVPKGSVPQMLLWDTGDPYYYVRLASIGEDGDDDILIVGGQDHKTGQDVLPQHRWNEVEMWTRNRFPTAGEVVYRWSGEIMEPADGVAYLGRNPMDDENVFIITGDSGNGMTHCTAGAMLVRDAIMGRTNPWSAIYEPSRKPVHGMGEFVIEQANVLKQYGTWLKSGEASSPEHIAPGEGALIRRGLALYAVHRPVDGPLQVLSAKCTHLGCAVHWNSAEKTWDCPCHASRFTTGGDVIHGPAVKPLPIVSLPRD